MDTSQTMMAHHCNVCGRATVDYAMVGNNQRLCMELPEDDHTAWGRDSAAKDVSCFGWFALYAYDLIDFVKQLRKEVGPAPESEAQGLDLIRDFVVRIGRAMLLVREKLAQHEEYEFIFHLQNLGLIPEQGKPWPPSK